MTDEELNFILAEKAAAEAAWEKCDVKWAALHAKRYADALMAVAERWKAEGRALYASPLS